MFSIARLQGALDSQQIFQSGHFEPILRHAREFSTLSLVSEYAIFQLLWRVLVQSACSWRERTL
jgi:hypothetical protein